MHQTTANIGHSQELGLGGFYNINITSKMSFSVNGRIAYVNMRSDSPLLKNSGWTGDYGANWNYTTPKNFRLSVYGGQSFNQIHLQGSNKGWYYYGLGASRNFFNDAFSVGINATNFLQSYVGFRATTHVGDKHTYNYTKSKNWRIGINLTWNFGSLKSSAKKTDLIIENDDISNTGNNKTIGI